MPKENPGINQTYLRLCEAHWSICRYLISQVWLESEHKRLFISQRTCKAMPERAMLRSMPCPILLF